MRLRVVYVCIVGATAPRGWRGVQVKDEINRKCSVVLILLINSNWEQRGGRCFAHTQQPWPRGRCGWREHMYCRDRASLDMSFKTPMLSRCSIFIHLQVSDRSLGQHIVSGTCQLSRTYAAFKDNVKPHACLPAPSSHCWVIFSSLFPWMHGKQFLYSLYRSPFLTWIFFYTDDFSLHHTVNTDKTIP